VTQVVVPTEQAAQALAAKCRRHQHRGRRPRQGPCRQQDRRPDARQAGCAELAAVADAVFAAAQGKVATPAKSGLGWHVIRVDAIVKKPARRWSRPGPNSSPN
jgi:peptidyl-prolyl cis-trans isomerase D